MKVARFDLHMANRPRQTAPVASLLLAVVVLVAAVQYLDALRDRGIALDAREAAIRRGEGARRAISEAHRAAADPKARELMARQRYAMEPARDLMERGWRPGIALLLLDLATDARRIDMVFESRSAQEALAYVDWLEMQPAAERVVVNRQNATQGPSTGPVETRVQVIWRPLPGTAWRGEAPVVPNTSAPMPAGQR